MTEQHKEMASKPCKIHWCKPRFKSHEYNLRSIKGKCLEGVGIPDGGRAESMHLLIRQKYKYILTTARTAVQKWTEKGKKYEKDTFSAYTNIVSNPLFL